MDHQPEAVLEWPGLRSEYAELPPATQPTLTKAGQVGVAFSGHARTVRESDGRAERVDVPPGAVYVTGAAPLRWLEVPDPTEALEMYPDSRLIERAAGGRIEVRPAVAPFYGGESGVRERLARAAEAVAAYRTDGTVTMVPAYREGDERAAMALPLAYYAAPDRGVIAAWRNEMAQLSWPFWLTFNGLAGVEEVSAPCLFVHSDDCVLPDNVRAITQRMRNAELVWSEGSQIDFYDQRAQVDLAVHAADRHFGAHLRP